MQCCLSEAQSADALNGRKSTERRIKCTCLVFLSCKPSKSKSHIFIRGFDLCPLSEAILNSYLSFGGTLSVHCLEIEVVHISEVEMYYYITIYKKYFSDHQFSYIVRVLTWRA